MSNKILTITSRLITLPNGRASTCVWRRDAAFLLAWQSAIGALSAELTSWGPKRLLGLMPADEGGDAGVQFGYRVDSEDGPFFEQGPAHWYGLSAAGVRALRHTIRRHLGEFVAAADERAKS